MTKKYRWNYKIFLKNLPLILICLICIVFVVWFGLSYIEILSQNISMEETHYCKWNLILLLLNA